MKNDNTSTKEMTTIGLDLGDKSHHFCILDSEGKIVKQGKFSSTTRAVKTFFAKREVSLVAMEASTQSPWLSRFLESQGHKVLVGNPRKLKMIYASMDKTDERDAEMLARIARFDTRLLSPIQHRGPRAQADLAVLKSRDTLVKARTAQINFIRGMVKSIGRRLPSASAAAFHKKVKGEIPKELAPALLPVLTIVEQLNEAIRNMDRKIDRLCKKEYPETEKLRAIHGVGPTSSCWLLLSTSICVVAMTPGTPCTSPRAVSSIASA